MKDADAKSGQDIVSQKEHEPNPSSTDSREPLKFDKWYATINYGYSARSKIREQPLSGL